MTARPRPLLAALLLGALAGLVPCAPLRAAEEIDWRTDYGVARREAVEKDRPLILDFGTDDCFWCKRLDLTTLRDPTIVALVSRSFVAVRIDAAKEAALVEKLRIQAYPTILLASPEGRIIDVIEGFKEAPAFLDRLERVLTAVASPEWMARDYQEATQAIASADFARAISLLRNVVQDGKERSVQLKARQLLQDLEAQATARLARVKQLQERGQTSQAQDTLGELLRAFAGSQAAKEGTQLLATLTSRPEPRDDLRPKRARELLAQAKEDYRTAEYAACLARCDALATAYADLPEAAEARQMASEIKNNPEWLRQACEGLSDQLGTIYLTLAETWIKRGQPQQAILCLERVVQTLPGTRHAEAAQVRLAQIQGLPTTRTVEFKKP
jgi:tetratricopeptide (TPR) repeat protein